ncbi:MAG: peptide-methionine (S)-S-oxide reductase MsrA [Vulcanimicrobiaceae bacterium]
MKNRVSLAWVAFVAALAVTTAPIAATTSAAGPDRLETAVLAGGCFWGLEAVFEHVNGVRSVVSGYSGGAKETARYETVSTGRTGHAESVSVVFDPRRVSYDRLLDVFFSVAHDPTQVDRQGPDDGSQYRSVVFYTSEAQHRAATAYIARLTAEKKFAAPIATQVVPFRAFYAAEAYHQHFFDRNPAYPYIVINDAPKVAALRERFPKLVKPGAN